MARLKVPQRDRPGISAIGTLSESSILKVKEALMQVASALDAGTIGSVLAPLMSDLGIENQERVAEAIATLYRVRSLKEWPVEEFVDAVCESMEVQDIKREQLKKNLVSLLSISSISTIAKAWTLQNENERVYCEARIITDVRPVFGTEISSGPRGLVLSHLLKLGFHRQSAGDRHEDIYVSLDADDLDSLHQVIDRAKEKAKIIKASIKGFDYLARS